MAMNKKEKAEFEAAKKAVFVARALNWTDPVAPDIPVPLCGEARGFVVGHDCVMHGLSTSVSHASGWIDSSPPTRTTSQGARSMYSTKLLALRALRHAVECECAKRLAKIDMQIAVEKESKP